MKQDYPYLVVIDPGKQHIIYMSRICVEAEDDIKTYCLARMKVIVVYNIEEIFQELYA